MKYFIITALGLSKTSTRLLIKIQYMGQTKIPEHLGAIVIY